MGYRIRWSLTPFSHPVQTDWNGYSAAFTFSTDDGWKDNLVYAELFDRYDRAFTVFAIADRIDWEECLSAADLNSLHGRGHEIASHTVSHPPLTRNTAFTIQYLGGKPSCTLAVSGERLQTRPGGTIDLDFDLTDPSVAYLDMLVDSIAVRPGYTCVLDHYAARTNYCESRYLKEVCGEDIACTPYQALTKKGCDSAALRSQIEDSKAFYEGVICDTAYRCRTLAYPYFAHDQREMNALMEGGYLGARDGNIGFYPGGPPVDPSRLGGISVYQAPLAWGRPNNDMDEDSTRAKVRTRIASWKRDGEWANWFCHTLEELDSVHVDWILDEIVADGGVWVAPFGEVAEYVRRYHVTVENPAEEGGKPSPSMSAVLGGLPRGAFIAAVVVAYESGGAESGWSNEVTFYATDDSIVSVASGSSTGLSAPPHLRILPNPANPRTMIRVRTDEPGPAQIAILNVRGETVIELFDGSLPAGVRDLEWCGCDQCGHQACSGLYFCRYCSARHPTEVRRIVLLR
ncbi:MAG: polysaccharide deacetylase family protein [Candidatus Eisenbacteria bacterium]|nr:polysaccharide deacetylase family protein [Candidatus Eisenbacteria bacterium]